MLLPKQNLCKASPHPTTLIETHISHTELLGVMREGKDSERNVYRKRVYNDRDVRLIKGHLIGEREKHMGEAKNQVLQKI